MKGEQPALGKTKALIPESWPTNTDSTAQMRVKPPCRNPHEPKLLIKGARKSSEWQNRTRANLC